MTGVGLIQMLEENNLYTRAIPDMINPEVVLVCVDKTAVRKKYISVLNFGGVVVTVKKDGYRQCMSQLELIRMIKMTCR